MNDVPLSEALRRPHLWPVASSGEPPDVAPGWAGPESSPPSTKTITAAALKGRQFPPIRYVVPGHIAEGCTLLAGAPKLGKSWLVLEIAIAKAMGGKCLGGIETNEAGDVLYLALEDNQRRLQSRMDKLMLFGEGWPPRLTFATEWPRQNEGGIDAIRAWASTCKAPKLVVVDVLTMFRPPINGREGQYEHDYGSIKALQGLASELNLAVVIVHHTRKSRDQVDPFDRVSGTLGLSGAADAVLILDRDSNGVTLYGRGRDVPEIETAMSFDRDKCRWKVVGRAADVRLSDERKVILDALLVTAEPMSPVEIADAVKRPRNVVKQLLFKMMTAGEVLKVGRGRYIHPSKSDMVGL